MVMSLVTPVAAWCDGHTSEYTVYIYTNFYTAHLVVLSQGCILVYIMLHSGTMQCLNYLSIALYDPCMDSGIMIVSYQDHICILEGSQVESSPSTQG